MDYQNMQIKRQPIEPSKSPLSDIAFIISIIGLFCTPVPFLGFFGPALALILANMGRGYKMNFEGKGKAALIIGLIGLTLALIILSAEIYVYLTTVLPTVNNDLMELLRQYMNEILNESMSY